MSAVQVTPGSYARARVRELDRLLVQALNRVRALDYQLPRTRIRELATALADDLRRVRQLAAEFDVALDSRAAPLLDGLVNRLDPVLVDDLDHLARARALARRLTVDLDRFRALSDEFVEARQRADINGSAPGRPESPAPATGSAPVVAPARAAAGLVAQAVRALPPAHRARWREEFDAELEELAASAVSRWGQVGHATRLACRVWVLRRALLTRSPAGGRA